MPSACGDRLTCLPTLCRFQVIDSWDSEGKPLTRPQHAQMLSGYSPQTNGVYRNNGNTRMPPGYTIYERIKAARPEVKTLHVAGRKYVSRGVVKYAQRNGALDYYARRGGPDERTGVNTTLRIAPMLEEVSGGPFLAFVHYKEADVTAHESGAETEVYREAIISLDRELQALLDTLADANAADTKVLVTTDHGFLGQFHVSRDPANTDTWIATSNLELRTDVAAKLLDVTPTILDVFDVDTAGIDPPLEGASLLP
jgi:arylsulfatase A-like enzyme